MSAVQEALPVEQRAALKTLAATLRPFLSHDPTMHIPVALAFLQVAIDEGRGVGEYAIKLGVIPSTMSKVLMDLSESNRSGTPGLDLVMTYPAPMNRTRHETTLTHKGKALAHNLIHELTREA